MNQQYPVPSPPHPTDGNAVKTHHLRRRASRLSAMYVRTPVHPSTLPLLPSQQRPRRDYVRQTCVSVVDSVFPDRTDSASQRLQERRWTSKLSSLAPAPRSIGFQKPIEEWNVYYDVRLVMAREQALSVSLPVDDPTRLYCNSENQRPFQTERVTTTDSLIGCGIFGCEFRLTFASPRCAPVFWLVNGTTTTILFVSDPVVVCLSTGRTACVVVETTSSQ